MLKRAALGVNKQALRVGTIFAIGRNYAAHAQELGNAVPDKPIVFLKAASSLVGDGSDIPLPTGANSLHHEVELVVYLGKALSYADPEQCLMAVEAYGVGIDWTDRALQSEFKAKGLPWTSSKSFRGASAISALVPAAEINDPQDLKIRLSVDGVVQQDGWTGHMLHSVAQLLSYLSQNHDLLPGDLIFTGTPPGVGPAKPGQNIHIELVDHCSASFAVIARGSNAR